MVCRCPAGCRRAKRDHRSFSLGEPRTTHAPASPRRAPVPRVWSSSTRCSLLLLHRVAFSLLVGGHCSRHSTSSVPFRRAPFSARDKGQGTGGSVGTPQGRLLPSPAARSHLRAPRHSPRGVHGGMAPPCTSGEGIPAPPASSSITVQKMGAEFPPLLLSLSHPSLCPVPKRL